MARNGKQTIVLFAFVSKEMSSAPLLIVLNPIAKTPYTKKENAVPYVLTKPVVSMNQVLIMKMVWNGV
jgi:hypothetical protein